jgi:pimeloyl-ACP methyl ester carboxylesterase
LNVPSVAAWPGFGSAAAKVRNAARAGVDTARRLFDRALADAANPRDAIRRGIDTAQHWFDRAITAARDWRNLRAPSFSSVKPMLIWLLIIIACIYVGLAAVLYFAQRSLMYFPETIHTTPQQAGLADAEEVTLTTSDGMHPVVWHVAPRDGKPVILYFHGNGGALHYRADRFLKLIGDGIGLVALEYRGYGGVSGSPTEAGLMADAEAAYKFAAERYSVQQLVAWGESLGSGVAVALASEKPFGRIILEAPFTSAAAVGAERYWYMPVRLLMKDQFRSDERIAQIKVPVMILHGVHDHVVPITMGERLFELANQPKYIVRFLDGGHEDLDANGALNAIARFLAGDLDHGGLPPPPRAR